MLADPEIDSITVSFGCTLDPSGDNTITQKKNTTATYTVQVTGDIASVSKVRVSLVSGTGIASFPIQEDTSSPFAVQIKTVNTSALTSVVKFDVYEGTTIVNSFLVTIITGASNAC